MEQLLSRAAVDVIAERQRQSKTEGHSNANDDLLISGELAKAAASYAIAADTAVYCLEKRRPAWCESYIPFVSRYWPWSWTTWKPTTKRRDLVKAAALILAEIERLDRKADF